MKRRGIIITGVSGAGKTTIAQMLSARGSTFEQIKAVTTRQARSDDPPGTFDYLTGEQFDALEQSATLIIRAEYRGNRYGITRDHFNDVEGRGKVPILLVTPLSLYEFVERSGHGAVEEPSVSAFLTVFVDAPDETLDARLGLRENVGPWADVVRQRTEDRLHRNACQHVLENRVLDHSLARLTGWWEAA